MKQRNSKKKSSNNKKQAAANSNQASSSDASAVTASPSRPTTTVSDASTADPSPLITAAMDWKQEGNAAFSNQDYPRALIAYDQGLQVLQDGSVNSEDAEVVNQLRVQLYSNRAIAYIKSGNYERAERDCTTVLQELDCKTYNKVWYRRAQAREGLAFNCDTSERSQEYLLLAKEDLQKCLKFGEAAAIAANDSTSMEKLKRDVSVMAMRLQRSLMALQQGSPIMAPPTSPVRRGHQQQQQQHQQHQQLNGSSSSYSSFVNTVSPPPPPPLQQQRPPPSPEEQRRVVMELLMNEYGVLSETQAFYLMDWEWWCEWCDHVGFYTNENVSLALKYMPPGAVVAETSRDTDEEEKEEGESDMEIQPPSPGPIDNASLLLPPQEQKLKDVSSRTLFYRQWYQSYYTPDNLALKPGLVRGHDYEILPREVYFALKTWYGELTPPIGRRLMVVSNHSNPTSTSGSLKLPLYVLTSERPTPPETAAPCGACGAPVAVMRCRRCLCVNYCDRTCQEGHWPSHKGECKKIQQLVNNSNNNNNGNNSYKLQRCNGRVGLNNVGNTCFMNSALQSLSHATPLTRHFLSGKFKNDLNPSNPLGTGGSLAHAYEKAMKELHHQNSNSSKSSISPIALKRAIARFAPRFAGCLQHDAQEFLAYLLDGLHEDLNRIRKAPYVEMPDVTDGHNMAVAGAHAWEAHRRRNDSLVLDTFYGQFKSTCVCPKCNSVSVSFDAFNHVSLEIPQEKNAIVPKSILVFPTGTPSPTPTCYAVHIRRAERVLDLKEALSELCGIPVERLTLVEIFENTICQVYNDKKIVADIHPNEFIAAFEIDPFQGPSSRTTFHAVCGHKLLDPARDPSQAREPESFGLPFLTSFSSDLTCRQVWNMIWNNVDRMASSPDPTIDNKSLLQIRVVTQNGEPINVFPTADDVDDPLDGIGDPLYLNTASQPLCSILPSDSDELLTKFLGENAVQQFLFLNLEWTDPTELEMEEEGVVAEETKIEPRLYEERFLNYNNHSSMIEAEKKLKATAGKKGVTLEQCFETFTKPERLDEHNMWYCSSCKEHVRAMKTMALWKLPNVLILHLKRFEFKHALRRDKLDTLVEFPLEGLDMTSHCASRGNSPLVDDHVPAIYDCFAVVNHFGRMGFGHYTAFARQWDETGISRNWALFDDSSVQNVDNPKGIISPAAYVLFYRRRTFN